MIAERNPRTEKQPVCDYVYGIWLCGSSFDVLTQVAGQCSKPCHLEDKNLNVITVVIKKCNVGIMKLLKL